MERGLFSIFTCYNFMKDIADLIKIMESELDDVPAGSVAPSTPFRQLEGWNSMMALIIIARIDADHGITLTAQDLAGAVTVNDLFAILKSKN